MSPHSSSSSSSTGLTSSTSRLTGSAVAGGLELIIFHPVDTIAKRLMSNKTTFEGSRGSADFRTHISRIVFAKAYDRPAFERYRALFPGLGFAAGYKILQRVYKFGGQPVLNDWLNRNHGSNFRNVFGERSARTWMEAVSGSMVGVGEIALLPLDVLKIKSQTNPEALSGKGIRDIVIKNWRELYRGAGWTALRNAPGSFALFGGNQLAKTYVLNLEHGEKATFAQLAFTSMTGSVLSILVSAPLDVIKTRVQNRPFDSPESGMTVLRNIVRHEGPAAFFKGIVPKLVIVGPKLIFSFTVAQWLIANISNVL